MLLLQMLVRMWSLDRVLQSGQFRKVTGLVVDVTKEESVREFFDKLGEVDHVAITVGTSYKSALVADSELFESQKPFLVKYWGQFWSPSMQAQD